jgi:hypothetical protein
MTKGAVTALRLIALVAFLPTAIVVPVSPSNPDVAQLIAVDSVGLALFVGSFLP